MHVHGSQPSPNLQLDALYAAERASARREIERTRKKLMEFASQLAAESGEACVVKLEANEDFQEQPKQKNQSYAEKETKECPESGESTNVISDWA